MSSRNPVNLKLFVNMGSKVSMFNQIANEHQERQLENPFSGWEGASTKRKLSKEDAGYGKPIAGSKTEERGRKAAAEMSKELRELCDVIFDCGVKNKDGTAVITFGRLFTVYNVISDKCVGLLMRARKHGFVAFEGEMLFQRRDDDVIISLLKPINTIRHHFGASPIKNGGPVPTPELTSDTIQDKLIHLSVRNDGQVFVDSLPVTPDSEASPNLSFCTTPEPYQNEEDKDSDEVVLEEENIACENSVHTREITTTIVITVDDATPEDLCVVDSEKVPANDDIGDNVGDIAPEVVNENCQESQTVNLSISEIEIENKDSTTKEQVGSDIHFIPPTAESVPLAAESVLLAAESVLLAAESVPLATESVPLATESKTVTESD